MIKYKINEIAEIELQLAADFLVCIALKQWFILNLSLWDGFVQMSRVFMKMFGEQNILNLT